MVVSYWQNGTYKFIFRHLLVKLYQRFARGARSYLLPALKKLRDAGFICRSLFSVNNAIPMRDFKRILYWVGGLGVLFGLVAGWFLVLKPFID